MASRIPDLARMSVRNRDFRRCVRCGLGMEIGQWHHRRGRAVVDVHQHCPCNGINLCLECHTYIHAHPFEARRMGWIVSRNNHEPGGVPVFAQQHGWVFLTCDGEVDPAADPHEEEG